MQTLADKDRLAAFDPHWCVFWASHVRSSQLAIWLPYLRRSAYRYVIMASADGIPDRVDEVIDPLANVATLRPYAEAITWLEESPTFRGFLYIGSNLDNAAVMDAFPDASHVWLGHGESAKKANAHRTASVYDSVFVADLAAVRRYPRAIERWVRAGAVPIGVPIVDGLQADPWDRPRPIRTLIYAPTWEGRGSNVDYSSLAEAGPRIIEAMPALAERGTTVILRAHPGTSQRMPALKGLLEDMVAAGAVRGGKDKGEDLMRGDVIVSDVSGVTSEYLFTRRPAIMPVTAGISRLMRGERGIRAEYPWVYQWDVATVPLIDQLEALERSDPLRNTRATSAKRLFGDHLTLDAAVRSFDRALASVRWRRRSWPIRAANDARLRLARRATDQPARPRVSSERGDRVEGKAVRADATDPGRGGVDGDSHGGG
jgi:CDP-glycerol:poly(glycerophosphate) glycerophosphotransferase